MTSTHLRSAICGAGPKARHRSLRGGQPCIENVASDSAMVFEQTPMMRIAGLTRLSMAQRPLHRPPAHASSTQLGNRKKCCVVRIVILRSPRPVSTRMHALSGALHDDRTFPQPIDRLAWHFCHVAHRHCAEREPGPRRSRRGYADRTDLLGRPAVGRRPARAGGPLRCVRILRSARPSRAGTGIRDTATAGGRKLRRRTTFGFAYVRLSGRTPGSTPPGFTVLNLKQLFPAI